MISIESFCASCPANDASSAVLYDCMTINSSDSALKAVAPGSRIETYRHTDIGSAARTSGAGTVMEY
jgi:hypothetical protein